MTSPDSTSTGQGATEKWQPGERKRCANCPHFFVQKKSWQKFCSSKCKAEWNRYGSAYGKLREKLSKEMAREIRAIARPIIAEEIKAALGAIGLERSTIDDLNRDIAARAKRSDLQKLAEQLGGAEGLAIVRAAVARRRARVPVDPETAEPADTAETVKQKATFARRAFAQLLSDQFSPTKEPSR